MKGFINDEEALNDENYVINEKKAFQKKLREEQAKDKTYMDKRTKQVGDVSNISNRRSRRFMSLRESVLGDYLFTRKRASVWQSHTFCDLGSDRPFGWYRGNKKHEREDDLMTKNKKMITKTTLSEVVTRKRLAPMAEFVHPRDPVMALGFLEAKEKEGGGVKEVDAKRMKHDFKESVDLFRKVVDLEGVRIACFLFPERLPFPSNILDSAFEVVESGSLLRSELAVLLGSQNVDDFVKADYFFDIMSVMSSQSWRGCSRKARVSKIAGNMVYFSKTRGDVEGRKKELQSIREREECGDILNCWGTSHDAGRYVSGDQFYDVDTLIEECRGYIYPSDC